MKTSSISLISFALSAMAVPFAGAADNTYYIWAGATKANDEVNLLKSANWSTSDAAYAAPAEGTEMNSPQANWVLDYGAYLPISGKTSSIVHRIKTSFLDIASISIINHNATKTGYWASDGFHETGASTSIKFFGSAQNSSWNIGTFTYTGATGTSDSGVILGSAWEKSQAPDITIGTMNIGQGENTTLFKIGDYACSVAYATVENGDIKVGDPVSIYDVTGAKSLTVTGDINLHGNVTFKTNVWNEDAMASHSEYSPDIFVQGVVRMTQSDGGKKPIWDVLYRTSTISWNNSKPAVPAIDTFVKIGGLDGRGNLSNQSQTLDASTVKLIFTNKEDCDFSGTFTENRSSTIKTVMSVKMAGENGKKQIIRADSAFTGTVEVESGTLIMHSTTALGKLTMTGGGFGGIEGGVVVSGAEWLGGDIVFHNTETFFGGLADKITVEGTFTKSAEGKIGVDFSGLDAASLIEEGNNVFDLITANAFEGSFSSDANDDFEAKNLLNAIADFAWAGNTLTVTFSQVPEPAAIAALLGVLALGLAAWRRRR
ncbi:MAG: PEP-CTERM sorting domain-containing protein, partial [Opitutales bacterium]|nr:PEP-CTERM sorting domain-containing protein [Opitutales bacterium]